MGGAEIRLTDRVVNAGFVLTPHMFFYHINVGHPVIDKGSRLVAPIREVVWASHAARYRDRGVGYRILPDPRAGFAMPEAGAIHFINVGLWLALCEICGV